MRSPYLSRWALRSPYLSQWTLRSTSVGLAIAQATNPIAKT
ncbi:MAG: hypothetical protein ACO331_09000 [Prochlorothrix sp.]